jgi:hypothetical protein
MVEQVFPKVARGFHGGFDFPSFLYHNSWIPMRQGFAQTTFSYPSLCYWFVLKFLLLPLCRTCTAMPSTSSSQSLYYSHPMSNPNHGATYNQLSNILGAWFIWKHRNRYVSSMGFIQAYVTQLGNFSVHFNSINY